MLASTNPRSETATTSSRLSTHTSDHGDTPRWEVGHRLSAGAGVGAVVAFAIAYFVAGTPPSPDASTGAVSSYLIEHQDALLLQAFLLSVGSVLYLMFVCRLRTVIVGAADRDGTLSVLTVVSATALVVVLAIGDLPLTALVWRGPQGVDPPLVRLIYDTSLLSLYSLSSALALTTIVAPSIVILRTGVLPRALVALGLLSAAVTGAEGFGMFFRSGWMAAGSGPGLFSVILWNLWVLAAAVSCLRHDGARSRGPDPRLHFRDNP